MTVEDGKTVAEPADKPTKDGYDFDYWYSKDANTAYEFSSVVTADLTLTAKWNAITYTINYELNGGTKSADNPATYTIETDDITLKAPTAPADKPNFGGWFKEADFKTQVTKIPKGSTGNLTLYAYFSEKEIVKHSVKVMCGETEVYSGEVLDGAALSEDDVKKAAAEKIPEGCELEGFYSDAAFTTKVDFTKAITADTVIYAKITAKTFTVSFEGLEADKNQTVEYGKTATEPADKPTKDGFTFDGWDFDFSTAIKADTTVKAKWVNYEYLTYDAWGKISGIKSVIVSYEDKSDSLISVSPWSLITTKTVLSKYADKTDAKIKFMYLGNEDVAYDCPFLYSATDKDNLYGSKNELTSFKVKKVTKDGENSVEYSVADVVTAMGENEYLTYDAWGKISGIKSVVVTYENKSDSLISVSPWSLITTKTVLSGYSSKADAKIKFTYIGNEDVNYDCPFLYAASDKDDMYNSKAELSAFKVNAVTKDGENSVEYSVADIVAAMGENEYLTYDAWGKISGIKAVEISYTK